MTRKATFAFAVFMATILFTSCASKKTEQEVASSPDPNAWPEMESFHMVMAEAYHPYKDDKNLEPIKSLAENLAKEAEKWAGAPLPEKVNKEEVKARLEKLKIDSRKLADMIKTGSTNEQIGDALTALHESFHSIMEGWHK